MSNTNLGGFFRGSLCGGGGLVKFPPPPPPHPLPLPKLAKSTLETWNLVRKIVSENIILSTKTPLILLMSAFFIVKNPHFLSKIVPLLKTIVWELY